MKWKKGERVKLSGLKKNGTNLNNQIAIINSFNSDKGKIYKSSIDSWKNFEV